MPAQVNVSFSLSLELLSYQKLPADQMLPGVEIQKKANGEKEMVFTQNLLLEYNNQTMQVSLVCPHGEGRMELDSMVGPGEVGRSLEIWPRGPLYPGRGLAQGDKAPPSLPV